jgi:hypothetical protein
VTDSLPPEDPRDALIREQAARLEAQAGQIAAQDEQIAGHGERIAVLEGLVVQLREQLDAALRAASRNSGNSSMPPSADDLPGRRPPVRKGAARSGACGAEAEAGEAARVAGRGDVLAQGRRGRRPLPAGGLRVRR